MSYSTHVPLFFGLLKIKSATRLRKNERNGSVPMLRMGDMCFVWIPAVRKKVSNVAPPGTYYMRREAAQPANSEEAEKQADTTTPDPLESSILIAVDRPRNRHKRKAAQSGSRGWISGRA